MTTIAVCTESKHVWAKQDTYSDPGNIHRFRCETCGIWGYKQVGYHAKKKRDVKIYCAKGVHVLDPKFEWKRDWKHEHININPLNVVEGNNPDRNSPDDDSSDYRPPRGNIF